MNDDGSVASVDLAVGIMLATSATADCAAFVREVSQTLTRFIDLRWQLVVATPDAERTAPANIRAAVADEARLTAIPYALQPSDALSVPFHGLPGRARALQAILAEAQRLGAAACVLVDPHTTSPQEWLGRLVEPVMTKQAECVMPIYHRHPFSGGLIHGVVYPMFRALYGTRLRYPIAADASYSRAFIDAVLPEPIWDTAAGQVGIDLWLAATAVSNGFRLAEARIGARADEPSTVDVSTTVAQVVGALFADMESRVPSWQRIRATLAPPQFGAADTPLQSPALDVGPLLDAFRLGFRELQDVWAEVLPPLALMQWRRLATAAGGAFRVDNALWARCVYDFAVGYHRRTITREHLLPAFTPLYLGWLGSFVLEERDSQREGAEARIERLCRAFEDEKPYLISEWRWPDRFKPTTRRR